MKRRINMARWQPRVQEARRRGISLKAYAAEQGVSLYPLYRASQALRDGQAPEPSAARASSLPYAWSRPDTGTAARGGSSAQRGVPAR